MTYPYGRGFKSAEATIALVLLVPAAIVALIIFLVTR